MNAYYLGVWIVGFFVSFVAGYILLRLANGKHRLASTAGIYRAMAVLLAALIAYAASFDGLNIGSIIAVLAILAMVVFRQERR